MPVPDGFELRMMEPGEAEALRAINAGAEPPREPASRADFVRFLLRHEVFVVDDRTTGRPVGFAAAADLASLAEADGEGAGCYWLSALRVLPGPGAQGVAAALLEGAARRAGWFFHRALGVAAPCSGGLDATFLRDRGFVEVPERDWTPAIRARFAADLPGGADPLSHCAMVRWL